MIAFIFPGQGSQKKGMGQGLFDEVREYVVVEKEVDAFVRYSMRKLYLEDAGNRHYKVISSGVRALCNKLSKKRMASVPKRPSTKR